ncbi:hypothetical protein O181_060114 [Austropuccinia psidii MF-1]|uniref:Uncharacterized protein n=1 Tax=Austropuccinia psidii MF-1 TaxID=1389203 RepID=A0A9Q3EFP1_9BASI|nr:hypothetical protein [Austropuccinia psidii MF-1]
MDTKVGLGGKFKLSTNEPMICGDLRLKQPWNLLNSMLKKTKVFLGFANKKDRLTALYPDISELMTYRKILRLCGADLENVLKSRTTEQYSAEYIIDIVEEVTTRTRIGSSRVNQKKRFNKTWKDSVDKSSKQNSNNRKYKSAYVIRKGDICQSTTHSANACPRKGKINEIDIEKEPDVENDDVIEDNLDD